MKDAMPSKKVAERYEVVRAMRQSPSAKTFLVRDEERQGRISILKAFRKGGTEAERAFRRECELLHSLRHPHLVRLEDWGEENEILYYLTESLDGQDLVTEAAVQDWKLIFPLMVQACWALGELHEHGIIHRDLKPEDLLVLRLPSEGQGDRLRLKLVDFGMAMAPGLKEAAGTDGPPFRAPEILAGLPYDHRADLYSLGVIFYYLALAKVPHLPAENFSEYLEALSSGVLDLDTLREAEVPQGVIQCIAHLVLADPERRLHSAGEVIRCLNQFEQEQFPLSIPATKLPIPPAPSAKPPPPASSRPPEEILQKLLKLSRSGKKQEALVFAQPYLPQIWGWKDAALVADFLATLVYLLAELGKLPEAQHWLKKMQEHPALQARPHLETFLTGAYLAFRNGRRREAKALLEKAPESLIQQAPATKRARFENYLGMAFQTERDWVQAALHFERAADFAHEAKRRDQEANFSAQAAGLYFELNRWAKAYQLYQSSLSLVRDLGNRPLEASILHHLGRLYLYFGRWHEAEGSLIRSLDLARQQELKPLVAQDLYLMTVAEEGRGRPEKEEDYLRQALTYAEGLDGTESVLNALLARAQFEFSQGRFMPTNAALLELERAAENAGDLKYQLQAEWLRAKLALAEGRGREAWVGGILEKVREDAAGRAEAPVLWQVHADIAEMELTQKRFVEAEASFHRAQEILNELVLEVPEAYRESFFRDRKKQRILRGLDTVVAAKSADLETTDAAIRLEPELQGTAFSPGVSFFQWSEILRRLLSMRHVQPLLEELLAAALQLVQAERGFIAYSEQEELEIRAHLHLDARTFAGEEFRPSRTIAQEVLRQNASQIILDTNEDQRFSVTASLSTVKLTSLICVPLVVGGRAQGLIYLDNRLQTGVLTAEHLPLLEALAGQASLVLEQVRRHEEHVQTIQGLTQSKTLLERLNLSLERELAEAASQLTKTREALNQHEQVLLDLQEGGLDPQIADLEKKALLQSLEKTGGNKVKAAKLLKISRRTLYLKMEAFGIESHYGKTNPANVKKRGLPIDA